MAKVKAPTLATIKANSGWVQPTTASIASNRSQLNQSSIGSNSDAAKRALAANGANKVAPK